MGTVGAGVPGWVDLGTPDLDATSRFYGELFGWEPQVSPDEQYGGYTIFTKDGQSVAGAGPLMSPEQPVAWITYVIVDSADETAARVDAAGGQLIAPPFDVADQGRMAIFLDTGGAATGIWQPGIMKGAELFNAPGALSWDELATREVDAAKAFYPAVFGWGTEESVAEDGAVAYVQWLNGDRPVGGMLPMGDDFPADVPAHWGVYFGVADLDESIQLIGKLGGAVQGGAVQIPEGRFANATDPHGAAFKIFEPAAA